MDSKILLAVIGSTLIGALLIVSLIVSGREASFYIDHPGIYVLNVPRFDGVNRDFSNLRMLENGKDIPFWVESFDEKSAKVWIRLKKPGKVSITATNRMYRGRGVEVFPVFDDFSDGLKFWRLKNDLPQTVKFKRMPKTRKCMRLSVKDGHLLLENGRPFGKCRVEFERDLLKTAKIRLRASGRFEIIFSGRDSGSFVLENPFDKRGWEARFIVRGKTVGKVNLKPLNGWFFIKLSKGKVYLGDRLLNLGRFSPKRLSLSVGTPGRVEIDYVYSLNDYREVSFGK